jgi:hypothetical protein
MAKIFLSANMEQASLYWFYPALACKAGSGTLFYTASAKNFNLLFQTGAALADPANVKFLPWMQFPAIGKIFIAS